MARLRDIGLHFVDIIVNSDNEPARADDFDSVVEQFARMVVESRPVGGSKSNGIVGRESDSISSFFSFFSSLLFLFFFFFLSADPFTRRLPWHHSSDTALGVLTLFLSFFSLFFFCFTSHMSPLCAEGVRGAVIAPVVHVSIVYRTITAV